LSGVTNGEITIYSMERKTKIFKGMLTGRLNKAIRRQPVEEKQGEGEEGVCGAKVLGRA
jgi:hypothetical protein